MSTTRDQQPGANTLTSDGDSAAEALLPAAVTAHPAWIHLWQTRLLAPTPDEVEAERADDEAAAA